MRVFSRPSFGLIFALALLVVLAFTAREAKAQYRYGGYGYSYYSYPSYGYSSYYYYPSYSYYPSYYTYVPSTYVAPYSSYYAAPQNSQAPCPPNHSGSANDQLFKELALRLLAQQLAPQANLPAPAASPQTLRQSPTTTLTPQEIQLLRRVLQRLATEPPPTK